MRQARGTHRSEVPAERENPCQRSSALLKQSIAWSKGEIFFSLVPDVVDRVSIVLLPVMMTPALGS